jgi:hypothetical protein
VLATSCEVKGFGPAHGTRSVPHNDSLNLLSRIAKAESLSLAGDRGLRTDELLLDFLLLVESKAADCVVRLVELVVGAAAANCTYF